MQRCSSQVVNADFGGPGAGGDIYLRRFFDPKYYNIIIFDQRGAGRSTPPACIDNNTTQDLIKDIEKLRIFLKPIFSFFSIAIPSDK